MNEKRNLETAKRLSLKKKGAEGRQGRFQIRGRIQRLAARGRADHSKARAEHYPQGVTFGRGSDLV